MIKRLLLAFFILLCSCHAFSQKVDVEALLEEVSKLITVRKYPEATTLIARIDSNKINKNSVTKGRFYQQKARLYYYHTYEDAKAVGYYYKAINLFELNKSYEDVGIAYSNVAGILTDIKDYKRAEQAIEKATPFVKDNKVRYANLLVNHARIKAAKGNYAGSAELNYAAVKLYEEANDKAKVGFGYFQLGVIMEQARQLDKAVDFYNKALTIRRSIADTTGTINVLNNLGIVYKNEKNYDKALDNYQAALELAKKYQRPLLQLNPLVNLANIYKRKENYAKAIAINNEALALAKANKRDNDVPIIENNLCEIYLITAEYNKALPLARSIVEYGKTKGTLEEKIAFHNNLAEALYGIGQKEEGFKNLQLAFDLRDSLYKKQGAEAMAEMATKYETEKKEARIRLLASQSKSQRLALNNQKLELDKKELEIEKRDLEINTRDARIKLQRSQLTQQQLIGKQQQQQLTLLDKERSIRQLQLQQKNIYLGASAIAIILLLFGAFRYYSWRKMQESMALQREKLRISQELHDNIGSQLTFINNFVQSFEAENGQALKIKEAREVTANTIRELRRTVWLINQPEFSLDEFVIKLRDYVRPFETGKPLISISTTDDLSACILKPTTATHLFRIIQEAVNNSLKYADASQLDIIFSKKSSFLKVQVNDNGKGFDQGNTPAGYGLKNIQSRVDILKGNFNITSKNNHGTRVEIVVPV